jgi:hypothetical protein
LRDLTAKVFTSKRSGRDTLCKECGGKIEISRIKGCTLQKCRKGETKIPKADKRYQTFEKMVEFWDSHKLPNIVNDSITISAGTEDHIGFVSVIAIKYVRMMITFYESNQLIMNENNSFQIKLSDGFTSMRSKATVFKYKARNFPMRVFREPVSKLCEIIDIKMKSFIKESECIKDEQETIGNCAFIYDPRLNHKLMIRIYSQSKIDIKMDSIIPPSMVIKEALKKADGKKCIFDSGFVSKDSLILAPEFSVDASTYPFIIEYDSDYKIIPSILISATDNDCDITSKIITYKYMIDQLCAYDHVVDVDDYAST